MSKTAFLFPGQGFRSVGTMTEIVTWRVWKSPSGFNPDCPGPAIAATCVMGGYASLVQTTYNWS